MTAETWHLASNKGRALQEMARYLSSRQRDDSAGPVAELLTAYLTAGAFRRALVDSFTGEDIRRLCDAALGPKDRALLNNTISGLTCSSRQ